MPITKVSFRLIPLYKPQAFFPSAAVGGEHQQQQQEDGRAAAELPRLRHDLLLRPRPQEAHRPRAQGQAGRERGDPGSLRGCNCFTRYGAGLKVVQRLRESRFMCPLAAAGTYLQRRN